MEIYTFKNGSYITSQEKSQIIDQIIQDLKQLPQEVRTLEGIAFILDECLQQVKTKEVIL